MRWADGSEHSSFWKAAVMPAKAVAVAVGAAAWHCLEGGIPIPMGEGRAGTFQEVAKGGGSTYEHFSLHLRSPLPDWEPPTISQPGGPFQQHEPKQPRNERDGTSK